uniref:Uncharacterized protein n=1 Tax=Ixodes ricinus TaxID=34613 RepID=A0A6B0UL99_IXORI
MVHSGTRTEKRGDLEIATFFFFCLFVCVLALLRKWSCCRAARDTKEWLSSFCSFLSLSRIVFVVELTVVQRGRPVSPYICMPSLPSHLVSSPWDHALGVPRPTRGQSVVPFTSNE